MKHNTKKGFTLVELLVVIAILAILATVSVVGYTSFIESANVAVDEDLVAQLNNFLAAYKVNNTEDITEDNAWEVTQEILELSGLDKINGLVPKSKDNHFYFNVDEQEYQLVSDNLVSGSGSGSHFFNFLANAAGADKPGVFYKNGEKLFLVDTTGTALADVVRGFYTFDNIQGEDKFAEFQKKVDGIALEYPIISEWAKHSVFVTADGIKYVADSALTNYVFHAGRINIDNDTPNVTLSDRVVVPGNIEYIGTGAFNITYAESGKLVFTKPANEFAQYVSEDFINVSFEINGQDWHIAEGTDAYVDMSVITPVSDSDNTQYPIGATNPMESFDIVVNGAEDKLHNNYNNLPNNSVLVWDGETFTLAVTNKTAVDSTKPVSSNRVTYTLNGEPTGVSVAPNGTITLSKVDGVYPETASFTVTANAVYGEATQTITVLLARPTSSTITVDGETVGSNNKIELIYGQLSSGNSKNEYNVTASAATPVNHLDTFSYASDVVITLKSGTLTIDGKKLTASEDTFPGKVTNTDVVINVNIGGYISRDITLNILNLACYFEATGMNTVGTEGASVSFEHLFELMDGVTLPDGFEASVGVYPEPTGDATLADLATLGAKLPSSNKFAVYTDEGTPNTIDYGSDATFNLSLAGNSAKVVFVVTITNGTEIYRASENLVVDVIDAYNVTSFGTKASTAIGELDNLVTPSTSNPSPNEIYQPVVLLNDITMDGTNSYPMISFVGTTLYGNCNTFNIAEGATTGYWGVISLENAHMRDLRVLGQYFGGIGIAGDDPWGTNAVHAIGTSSITNCYVSNTRSPLCVGTEYSTEQDYVTVTNSVFYGGRYASIEIKDGYLECVGEVITVNQPHTSPIDSTKTEVGLGVLVWLRASQNTGIVNRQNLTQYNFIPNDSTISKPVVHIEGSTTKEVLGKSFTIDVEVDMLTSQLFDNIFNSTSTDFDSYIFEGEYMNAGVVGEDIGDFSSLISMETGNRTGFDAIKVPAKMEFKVTLDKSQFTGFGATTLYNAAKVLVEGLVASLERSSNAYLHFAGITNDNTQLFEDSKGAELIYSPWVEGGNEGYDFVNGSILGAHNERVGD